MTRNSCFFFSLRYLSFSVTEQKFHIKVCRQRRRSSSIGAVMDFPRHSKEPVKVSSFFVFAASAWSFPYFIVTVILMETVSLDQ